VATGKTAWRFRKRSAEKNAYEWLSAAAMADHVDVIPVQVPYRGGQWEWNPNAELSQWEEVLFQAGQHFTEPLMSMDKEQYWDANTQKLNLAGTFQVVMDAVKIPGVSDRIAQVMGQERLCVLAIFADGWAHHRQGWDAACRSKYWACRYRFGEVKDWKGFSSFLQFYAENDPKHDKTMEESGLTP